MPDVKKAMISSFFLTGRAIRDRRYSSSADCIDSGQYLAHPHTKVERGAEKVTASDDVHDVVVDNIRHARVQGGKAYCNMAWEGPTCPPKTRVKA